MSREENGHSESNKIVQIYSDFMTGVTKFEELLPVGNKLLSGFHHALGFLGRPSINKTSKLIDHIITSNSSRRVLSYIEAGCQNKHDGVQHVSKLHACHLGLQDHITKVITIVDELEHLLGDAASALHNANSRNEDVTCNFDCSITPSDEEELSLSSHTNPEAITYATTMSIVYNMVKQDYTMQARIVSSLNLKSSPEEVNTYCQMWTLRPFIDDDLMHKAWSLVSINP